MYITTQKGGKGGQFRYVVLVEKFGSSEISGQPLLKK